MSREAPLYLTDVSNHQGANVNFKRIKSEGYVASIAKCSQGTYFRDKYARRNILAAEKAGLIAGGYWFLEHGNIKKQLDLFLSQLPGRTIAQKVEERLIAIDVELSGWGNDPNTTDAWNAVHALHDKIGPHPILIYSGHWYWSGHLGNPDVSSLVNGKDCKLWVSRYVTGTGYGSTLYQKVPDRWWEGQDSGGFGSEKPTILQFTDRARIAGALMDANAFAGSLRELKALTTSEEPDRPAKKQPKQTILEVGPVLKDKRIEIQRHIREKYDDVKMKARYYRGKG